MLRLSGNTANSSSAPTWSKAPTMNIAFWLTRSTKGMNTNATPSATSRNDAAWSPTLIAWLWSPTVRRMYGR